MINLSSLLGGGMLLKQQLFKSGGTWTRPAKMAGNTVWLTMIGGGEGVGGGVANGGFGGQYLIRIAVDIGSLSSIPVTIGQGGVNGASAANTFNPGGATSFGALLTVLGGSSATGTGTPGGPTSASGTAATPVSNGMDTPLGWGARARQVGNIQAGGGGGGIVIDASGVSGGIINMTTATPAKGYGAGATRAGTLGAAGAPGAILVEWPEFV